MQLCYFNLFVWIWAVLLNRSFTGFIPELFITQVQHRIVWATEQTYWIRKADMWRHVQKYQFSNLAEC